MEYHSSITVSAGHVADCGVLLACFRFAVTPYNSGRCRTGRPTSSREHGYEEPRQGQPANETGSSASYFYILRRIGSAASSLAGAVLDPT